jgi:hypothetical protein
MLKEAFEKRRIQTERYVERLKQVFQLLGEKAQPKPCKAMMGLVEEGQETIEKGREKEPYSQISLIAAAQPLNITKFLHTGLREPSPANSVKWSVRAAGGFQSSLCIHRNASWSRPGGIGREDIRWPPEFQRHRNRPQRRSSGHA